MFRARRANWLITPMEAYYNHIRQGVLQPDHRQELAMRHLQRVYEDVCKFHYSTASRHQRLIAPAPPNRMGLTPIGIIKRDAVRDAAEMQNERGTFHPLSDIKGLYLYGGVGCDVHKSMHIVKSLPRTAEAEVDIVEEVARRMIANAEVLCFDEMVVADIADAMLLRRLFQKFYRIGVCAVFTSNRHPDELYKAGLNRESFIPFIRMVKQRCHVVNMNSDTDYRLTGEHASTYFSPITPEKEKEFNEFFRSLTKHIPPKPKALRVFGRDVPIPEAVGEVCRFTFADLCGKELGPADYDVIAKSFHTVFISHIPTFSPSASDAKRRFIMLLDALYQRKAKVVILANAEPQLLEEKPLGIDSGKKDSKKSITHQISGKEETGADNEAARANQSASFDFGQIIDTGEDSFQMQRAISRLFEMRTKQYLQSPHSHEDISLATGAFPAAEEEVRESSTASPSVNRAHMMGKVFL